ncbi:MAG: NAD-dependent epimerase/dehydratase family protein [Thermodesulfobacteriota bacterium]
MRPETGHGGRVLVTGATGFIGRALCSHLLHAGIEVRGTTRRHSHDHLLHVGDVHGATDWGHALTGVRTVVHLAGKSAARRGRDDLALLQVNVEGAVNLARQAARAKVKRLIYLSSVKVLGESSPTPFTAHASPNPATPYAWSKHEAEQALAGVARQSGLELVILRPPLVYGRGAAGNFGKLLRLAASGLPLPLASVNNQRSLLSLDSLCDLILLCLHHPEAPRHAWLAADGSLSTPALFRLLAAAMGKPARLFPASPTVLRLFGELSGTGDLLARLLDSLEVDDSLTRRLLGWRPACPLAEGLRRCLA